MEILITSLATVLASGGLWTFLMKKTTKKDNLEEGVTALLHDRIYHECEKRLNQPDISRDDYENLQYLYKPYKELGGNGTCERLMSEIDKLPIRRN